LAVSLVGLPSYYTFNEREKTKTSIHSFGHSLFVFLSVMPVSPTPEKPSPTTVKAGSYLSRFQRASSHQSAQDKAIAEAAAEKFKTREHILRRAVAKIDEDPNQNEGC
jgi:hypothetical protein